MWPVPDFPDYLVWYQPTSDGIEVFRVLHGARDRDAIIGVE
jgi:hypothetical protein